MLYTHIMYLGMGVQLLLTIAAGDIPLYIPWRYPGDMQLVKHPTCDHLIDHAIYLWMWRYRRGQPRKVTVAQAEQRRRE